MLTILGLAGGAKTGKDYIVEHYLKSHGFNGVGFADPMKVDLVGRGVMTFEEAFILPKSERTRSTLVHYGEARRYVEGIEIWTRVLRADLQRFEFRFGLNRFVITDCRRPFEVEAIHQLGGKVIGIRAPQRWAASGLTDEQRLQSPELFGREFDEHAHLFDAVLDNDPEHEASVPQQLTSILAGFGIGVLSSDIRIGTGTITTINARPKVTVTGIPVIDLEKSAGTFKYHELEPLCLTCGPKNITWMGPVVQMCDRCQKEFDKWQSSTTQSPELG